MALPNISRQYTFGGGPQAMADRQVTAKMSCFMSVCTPPDGKSPPPPARCVKKLGLTALTALMACVATAPPPRPAPVGVERWGDTVDWAKAGDEAVEVLSGYLKVDTFNPPGNELAAAKHLAALLERE